MERRGHSPQQFFSQDTAVDPAAIETDLISNESSFGFNDAVSLPIVTVYRGDVLAQEAVDDELDYASGIHFP